MAELGKKLHWLANQKTEQNWIKVDPYVIVTLITRQQVNIFQSIIHQSIEKCLLYSGN